MNGVFFTRLKAKKLFRFNKEVPTAVASIPIAFETVIVVMNCLSLVDSFKTKWC